MFSKVYKNCTKMRKRFMALLFGMIILIVCEILLIYIVCTTKPIENGKFKYEETYICIPNDTNDTTVTTPYTYTMTSTKIETTTSSVTNSSTTQSTELTSTFETTTDKTSTISSTQYKSSTYSAPPVPPPSIKSTTLIWDKTISTQSTSSSITTSSVINRTMISTYSTETSMDDTSTTAMSETPSTSLETSSQVPSDITSTVGTTDMSTITTSKGAMRNITTVTASSQTSSTDVTENSSIDISTTTPSIISSTVLDPSTMSFSMPTSSTAEVTTFDPTTITKSTNATTITTTVTDADTRNCTEVIVTNFNYIVRHAVTNVACILINMKMWINLQYTTEDLQTGKATLMVPIKARTTGDCDEKRAKMTLSWDEPTETRADSDDKENRIIFHYVHNDVIFFLDSVFVDVHLDSKNFPRARQERISGRGTGLQLFYAPVKDGVFMCTMDTAINVENQITAVISDMRLIAFNNCSTDCWKTEDNCISKINVNVGAIVSAVIIGILLIFIIFYLTWRKKKNNVASFKIFS